MIMMNTCTKSVQITALSPPAYNSNYVLYYIILYYIILYILYYIIHIIMYYIVEKIYSV